MDEWVETMIQRVKETPPTCLHDLIVSPAHAADWDEWARWKLVCRCGNDGGVVLGHSLKELVEQYRGPDLFVSPLAFRCAECTAITEFFDTLIHGHDAELGKLSGQPMHTNVRGTGERIRSTCPQCAAQSHEVTARCSHPHFDLIEDEPELEPRVQDFFDAFVCDAQCSACGHAWTIASFELA